MVWGSGLAVIVIAAGLQNFHYRSFHDVAGIEELPPNDLTVVLAGGRGRIKQALELVAQGRSKKLVIIGAGAALEEIIPQREWPVGVAKDLVQIETESNSTFQNALKIRDFVLSQHLREVTVVTSFYHVLRTRLILRRVLPRWTNVSVVGVQTANYKAEGFWIHPLSLRLSAEETLKYVWYWLVIPQIL